MRNAIFATITFLLLAVTRLSAQPLVATDGMLSPTVWVRTTPWGLTSPLGSNSVFLGVGGNSGACVEVTNTLPASATTGTLFAYNLSPWNFAVRGPIRNFELRIQARYITGDTAGQRLLAVVVQNGIWYTSDFKSVATGAPAGWSTFSLSGLVPADFAKAPGQPTTAPATPSFASNAAPMFFGFASRNTSGSTPKTTRMNWDNWRVTVNHAAQVITLPSGCPASVNTPSLTTFASGSVQPIPVLGSNLGLRLQNLPLASIYYVGLSTGWTPPTNLLGCNLFVDLSNLTFLAYAQPAITSINSFVIPIPASTSLQGYQVTVQAVVVPALGTGPIVTNALRLRYGL